MQDDMSQQLQRIFSYEITVVINMQFHDIQPFMWKGKDSSGEDLMLGD